MRYCELSTLIVTIAKLITLLPSKEYKMAVTLKSYADHLIAVSRQKEEVADYIASVLGSFIDDAYCEWMGGGDNDEE